MATNGKAKGARAELEICKLLHAWWIEVESKADGEDIHFKRTPGSGGWAHGKGRAAFGTSADIVTNAKRFPFAVEAKHREAWSEENLAKGNRSPVWQWWEQAIRQGEETKRVPMLWFRKNRYPWLVMLPEQYALNTMTTIAPVATYWMRTPRLGWSTGLGRFGEHWPIVFDATAILSLPAERFAKPQDNLSL